MKTKQDVDVFRKSLRTDGIVSVQVLDGRHTVGIIEFPYMRKLTARVVQVSRSVKSHKMLRDGPKESAFIWRIPDTLATCWNDRSVCHMLPFPSARITDVCYHPNL